MKQNINKSKLKKSILVLIALLVIVLALLFFLTNGINNKNKNKNNKSTEKFVSKKIDLTFESRVDKLKEFDSGKYIKHAWLQVQGTNMDLPILSHASADAEDEIEYSYGWISLDYKTGENRPVIMGHNILNVSNEPMLPNETLQNFEELMAFTYYGFAKDNQYIQYTTDNDDIYLIYAVGFYDYYSNEATSFSNKKETTKYIKAAKKNSIYDYDLNVNANDTLLTIKTCTRYFGADEKQELIVDARKLRKGEEVKSYQVKTTDNFEKLNLNHEKS